MANWDCLKPAVSSTGLVGEVLKDVAPGHLSQSGEFATLSSGLTATEVFIVLDFCKDCSLSISPGLKS